MKQDRSELAVKILAAAEHAYVELGTSPSAGEKAQMSSCLEAVQRHLSRRAFETTWDIGRAMRADDALEIALLEARDWTDAHPETATCDN